MYYQQSVTSYIIKLNKDYENVYLVKLAAVSELKKLKSNCFIFSAVSAIPFV